MATEAPAKTELIAKSIDKQLAGKLEVNRQAGGLNFQNMSDVMEFSKLLSVSQQAVPAHCRGQVGICLGITIQAIEWRMSPYAVASKSYVVSDRLAYESQLIHAVIEQRAPIQGRLRHEFIGEGQKRKCRVWATPRGETEPLEYVSPETGSITPKNSPLWKTKPDLQLFYNASRDWARLYFPDVLLGVYADDELEGAIVEQGGPQLAGMDALKKRLALQVEQREAAEDDEESSEHYQPGDEPDLSEQEPVQAPKDESAIVKYFRTSISAQKTNKGRGDVLAEAAKQLDGEAMLELESLANQLSESK